MKTLGFGEILFDRIDGVDFFGGAPVNVAVHLSRMGTNSYIISALGNDRNGEKAEKILRSENVKSDFIQFNSYYPTGLVDVTVEDGIPNYDIKKNSAWDYIELMDEHLGRLESANWELLHCGTLAQRTESNRMLLKKLISVINFKHIFFDVNLRQDFYSKAIIRDIVAVSTILKINDEELPVISNLLFGQRLTGEMLFSRIISLYRLELLILTMGSSGAQIYHVDKGEKAIFIPAEKIKVVDTVGAGDSFSGAFLASFLSGESLEKAGRKASRMAAFVAEHEGALPHVENYKWLS